MQCLHKAECSLNTALKEKRNHMMYLTAGKPLRKFSVEKHGARPCDMDQKRVKNKDELIREGHKGAITQQEPAGSTERHCS